VVDRERRSAVGAVDVTMYLIPELVELKLLLEPPTWSILLLFCEKGNSSNFLPPILLDGPGALTVGGEGVPAFPALGLLGL